MVYEMHVKATIDGTDQSVPDTMFVLHEGSDIEVLKALQSLGLEPYRFIEYFEAFKGYRSSNLDTGFWDLIDNNDGEMHVHYRINDYEKHYAHLDLTFEKIWLTFM